MPTRHVPERTCVICGTKTAKRDLIRVVLTPEGACVVDETGKQAGRGAYLCHQDSCWEKALKGGRLSHSLRADVSAEDKAALEEYRLRLVAAPST